MKKYELVAGTGGLYRIKALRSFRNVKEGDLGGYVASEKNLSHDGNCWVYDNAKVIGNAQVGGNEVVGGKEVRNAEAKVKSTNSIVRKAMNAAYNMSGKRG